MPDPVSRPAVKLSEIMYDLPQDRIAKRPAPERAEAKLLPVGRRSGALGADQTARALIHAVRPGDCWVINDTRVRPARVYTRKPSGGKVELLVLSARGRDAEAMYRSAKPLKAGQTLVCNATGDVIRVMERLEAGHVRLDLGEDVDILLARAGEVPLPPYIDRVPDDADVARYQTVYADEPGAVAAPTAGLHLTADLMASMEARGATFARVTLHVGPGTFRPIRTEDIADHELHSEWYRVSEVAATQINSAKRVVAVGTTAVRTLESVATGRGTVSAGSGDTTLYITPGFDFQVTGALLTNFHLPGSSLLVLVAAFCGMDTVRSAYAHALANDYRFYSYGDAMFIASEDA